MIKNFQEFVEVAEARSAMYQGMNEAFLSAAGREVRDMYTQVISDCAFADTAAQLLGLADGGEEYVVKTTEAKQERRAMVACLLRLAQEEA